MTNKSRIKYSRKPYNKAGNVVQGPVMRISTMVKPSHLPWGRAGSSIKIFSWTLWIVLNININIKSQYYYLSDSNVFSADGWSFPSSPWWEGKWGSESRTGFISLAENLAITWKRNKRLWEGAVQERELSTLGAKYCLTLNYNCLLNSWMSS